MDGPVGAGAALLLQRARAAAWYSRYPSAEIVMQALLFAALLAADRALVEPDRFSGVVAGLLLGLMMWLRYDVVLAFARLDSPSPFVIRFGVRCRGRS